MFEDFVPYPKTPRLYRDVIVTEKIDGTNAQIVINDKGETRAGSRNRWITPEDDNYGFARWVQDNSKKEDILENGGDKVFKEDTG